MTETAPDHETQPDAYALGVANAQARLDEAAELHRDAQAREQRIQGRIAALATERASIMKSRDSAADQDDEKTGSRLALITADLERLGELLAPASEATRAANQAVAVATEKVKQAHAEHARHVAQQDAQALECRLRELEKMLLRGIAQLAELKRASAPRTVHLVASEVFKVSDELVRLVVQGVVPR